MKNKVNLRLTLSVLLLAFLFNITNAQKVIENPKYGAATISYIDIKKVTLTDTATIIDYEIEYFQNWWIKIEPSNFIQDSDGGDKLIVRSAKGIELGKKTWTPKSGVNIFTLYYPPLDETVEKIDIEIETWKIFDLQLKPSSEPEYMLEAFQGNWLTTDGTKEWVFGVDKDIVIYKNKVWNKFLLKEDKKTSTLVLKDGNIQETINLTLKKEHLNIGTADGQTLSLERGVNGYASTPAKLDKKFKDVTFENGLAVFKGYIKGYHPKMGKTGMVYAKNAVQHNSSPCIINIEEDGSFEAEVTLAYAQVCYFKMVGISETVFLEPGTMVFQYLDFSEYAVQYRNDNERAAHQKKSYFMGDNAQLNTELMFLDSINYFNYKTIKKKALDMSIDDYKSNLQDITKREYESFDKLQEEYSFTQKTKQIFPLTIRYRAYQNLLSFDMMRESAYRAKHKVPRSERELDLEPLQYTPEDFDFMRDDNLNNSLALLTGGDYYYFLNRLFFADIIREEGTSSYLLLKEQLVSNNIELSAEQSAIIDSLIANKDNHEKIHQLLDKKEWSELYKSNKKLISQFYNNQRYKTAFKNMDKYFGIKPGMITDIYYSQRYCSIVKGGQKPLSEDMLIEMKENILDPSIEEEVKAYSNNMAKEIKAKLEANKNKTGYVINENPKVDPEKIFDSIISKYKGKVIYIDFWATWCSPCRRGMENIKPLKEEMKGEDLVFLYITNETSPIDTWNMMVPDIKGEHYRVSKDQWNHLSARFGITGIPHYMVVDKEGKVVEKKLHFTSSNSEIKKVLNKYLNN